MCACPKTTLPEESACPDCASAFQEPMSLQPISDATTSELSVFPFFRGRSSPMARRRGFFRWIESLRPTLRKVIARPMRILQISAPTIVHESSNQLPDNAFALCPLRLAVNGSAGSASGFHSNVSVHRFLQSFSSRTMAFHNDVRMQSTTTTECSERPRCHEKKDRL